MYVSQTKEHAVQLVPFKRKCMRKQLTYSVFPRKTRAYLLCIHLASRDFKIRRVVAAPSPPKYAQSSLQLNLHKLNHKSFKCHVCRKNQKLNFGLEGIFDESASSNHMSQKIVRPLQDK